MEGEDHSPLHKIASEEARISEEIITTTEIEKQFIKLAFTENILGDYREAPPQDLPIIKANINVFARLSLSNKFMGSSYPIYRKILCSPFAIKLYSIVSIMCPVCLEDVKPIMALACGHCLYPECFGVQFSYHLHIEQPQTIVPILLRENAGNQSLGHRRTYPYLYTGNED